MMSSSKIVSRGPAGATGEGSSGGAVLPAPAGTGPLFDWPGPIQTQNDRRPGGFGHQLHGLELFSRESLASLVTAYQDHPDDYFISRGAPSPAAGFYSVPHGYCDLGEAARTLDVSPARILLKRLETRSAGFRALLDRLMEQVLDLDPGLRRETIVRLESALFMTSARTTTPFHFDPEVNFFFQIEGAKTYHVYDPGVLSEAELEAFYKRNVVNIGQVDLPGRDPSREQVFQLQAGDGLWQPQNAPHWVETSGGRSVSYSFVFETRRSREVGRTRSFNHYLRKAGIRPAPLRRRPPLDGLKASTMRLALPARDRLWRALHPSS